MTRDEVDEKIIRLAIDSICWGCRNFYKNTGLCVSDFIYLKIDRDQGFYFCCDEFEAAD